MELSGKTVVITRAASQSAELRSRLEELGARVIECPTIQIVPPKTWKPVDDAIRRLNTYQWLLFTSANAVEQFMDRMGRRRPAIPIAVVGSTTAAKLGEGGPGAAPHRRKGGRGKGGNLAGVQTCALPIWLNNLWTGWAGDVRPSPLRLSDRRRRLNWASGAWRLP